MPSLKEAIAAKKAAQEPTLRRNPEIDAKLDRFIGENPDLREYYEKLSKDELIRKLMLGKMQRSDYANGHDAEIRPGSRSIPRSGRRSKRASGTCRRKTVKRAFINAAKSEAMNQTVRRNGNGIRP